MHKIIDFADRYILNRMVFKIVFIVAMMITAVPYLHSAVGGYVKFLLAYGFVIVAYELLTKKAYKLIKDKVNIVLAAFCVSYLVTILINRSAHFSDNIKALAYMALFFILFFMMRVDETKEKLLEEIKIVSAVVIGCTFVLSLISLGTYVFSISGEYMTSSGVTYYGMYDNRLWALYNANTGSMLNCISIVLSAGFMLRYRGKISNYVLNGINILIQLTCLILTGSRAAFYALIGILVVGTCFLNLRMYLRKYEKISLKCVLTGVMASVVIVAAFIGTTELMKVPISYVPSVTANLMAHVSGDSEDEIIPIERYDLTRMEELEDREGGFFNGRASIWKACFEALEESPVFGVGRENIYERAAPYLDGGEWSESLKIGGPHNIYVCILVSSGALGFCLMMGFFIYTFVKSGLTLLKKITVADMWLFISFLLTGVFYVTEFVEARILYQVGIFNVLFWIYCGYMYAFAKLTTEEKRAGEIID